MWEVTGCDAGCQEVGKCGTRGGSWEMYITFASTKKQIRQNPLWLWNPEETSPEIHNRGTSRLKKGHVSVSANNIWKKNNVQALVIGIETEIYE